ncbi:MAG: DUF6878 family protein [Rhizomicrobium sp.]
MTDHDNTFDTDEFMRDYKEKNQIFKALCESVHNANKTALFDALAAAGVTSVLVRFDGSGDSGQIEEIDSVAGDVPRDLPAGTIAIASPHWGDTEAQPIEMSIRDAVEKMSYDFLELKHAGWENNEGAYGEFTFTVAERSIVLDYNERIETSEYTQHTF